MLDFTVPFSPGWGKRVRAAEGPEDCYIEAISPRMLAEIDKLHGQHNVFADLELPNPEIRQAKCLISILFREVMNELGISQAEAAASTGLTETDVSNLLRGRNSGFSLDRMLQAITKLETKAE